MGEISLDAHTLKHELLSGPWWDAIRRVSIEQALNEASNKGNLGEGTLVEKACEILGFSPGSEEAHEVQRYFSEHWEAK